jgi:GNAT superfamily N-acetyltransferase
MNSPIIQRRFDLPPCGLAELVRESLSAGLPFVQRLVQDWSSGSNRFDQPGEGLFVAISDTQVIGVCGLNRDPYAGLPEVGRVRHLYVLASYRRLGVGRRLVREVERLARERFTRLRLRTNSTGAARFYLALGFEAVSGEAYCTHQKQLVS